MSKVVLVVLAATTVGLGLVSLHLVKQLREGDATIAKLQEQVATLEKQAQAATAPALAPAPTPFTIIPGGPSVAATAPKDAPKSAAARASGQAATPASAPQMPSREEQMRMMREHRERQRQLMQDPEYRAAMRLQVRNNMARHYPGVVEELGLDQQQAEEFFGILAEQQMRSNELMSSLWENGESSDPAAAQERHREIQRTANDLQSKNEADIAARFGQDKLQAWKDYRSTMGMRFHLDQMRSTLAAQGLPLSEDLSKPMLKALAEVHKAEAAEYMEAAKRDAAPATARLVAAGTFDGPNMERQIEQTKKRNQRMLDALSSYLTYEQRTAIEKEQQAQLKMQEAQLRLMRERGDAGPNLRFYADGSTQLVPIQP